MNAEQIILTPITTPSYPDPSEARRYIHDTDGFYGYDYVFLEDATWNALCEIAHERGRTVDGLCCDQARKDGKTYLVASTPLPNAAIYIFASDHPDAVDPAINVMLELRPSGEPIRRPALALLSGIDP